MPLSAAIHPTLNLRNTRYQAYAGEHPHFASTALFQLPMIVNGKDVKDLQKLDLPVTAFNSGHTRYEITEADGAVQHIPLTPLLVRDFAGRVIYTGAGIEEKTAEDWPQDLHRNRLPVGCADLTATTPGANEIETLFLTEIRTVSESDQRLDTCYQDAWRLPQTEMLFARPVKDTNLANLLGQKLLAKWHEKPGQQTYTEFYEKCGGESYFEDLFLQGCTLIPTFEGCNGFNKVSERFELTDFWPGRAIDGLHEVAETRNDNAPAGTILEVLRPGYITATTISPTKVIVSSGSGYTAPKPMFYPDLRLPHLRCNTNWGNVWLPTKPNHFAAPALWGWDEDTGRFIQQSGPLWDPLHYTYTATKKIKEQLKKQQPNKGVAVPEDMKTTFHPVVLQGGTPAYHPLPPAKMFELDPYLFPELAPHVRMVAEPPTPIKEKLVKPAPNAAYLKRYTQPDAQPTPEDLAHIPTQLPEVSQAELTRHIRRAVGGAKRKKALTALHANLFEAHKAFREQALWWRRLRYRLNEKYPKQYVRGFWQIEEPELTEKALRYQNVGRKPKQTTKESPDSAKTTKPALQAPMA